MYILLYRGPSIISKFFVNSPPVALQSACFDGKMKMGEKDSCEAALSRIRISAVGDFHSCGKRFNLAKTAEGRRLPVASVNVTLSDINIQWHPAFCAAAELELSANRAELDFQREYNLSKKPLQIDLLVVEKLDEVSIQNEIGRIFRRYNVIEYKSPGDGMTIDDFFKTVGYACIYKGLGETVDQIPIDQLTVSLFREGYPEELFSSLERYGLAVKKEFDGVYYVEGLLIPAQVVVTRELESGKHLWLKVLSRNPLEEDVLGFVEDAQKLTEEGERANMDAVLQVSLSANYKLYEELKRRYPEMCEAMKILMHDELSEAQRDGIAQGEMKKAKETAINMKKKGYSDNTIAELLEVGVNIVQQWVAGTVSLAK